jgi:hypothetical protein
VQQLSISTDAQQISPSRKPALNCGVHPAQSKGRQQADDLVTLMIIYVYKQSVLSLKPNGYIQGKRLC